MEKDKADQRMSRRNCIRCTRWRLLSDYRPYYSNERRKEYLRKTCDFCCKKKYSDRYFNLSSEKKKQLKERTREYAAARRRREGIPVRNILKKGYGSGRVTKDCNKHDSVDPIPILEEAKRVGWNNQMIAKNAKVDVRRVNDWFYNKRKMSIDAADRLCFSLGTHLDIVYPL